MKCEDVMDMMQRHVDHDLNELETARLMNHVAECRVCAEKFRILQVLSRNLEELPAIAPQYSLVDAILPQLEAIDEARREQGNTLQEMKPVTSLSASGREQRDEPVPWWKKAAGYVALGGAMAAAVVGAVALTYEPKTVDNAEVQLATDGSTGSGHDTHNAAGGAAIPGKKKPTASTEGAVESGKLKERERVSSAANSSTGAESPRSKFVPPVPVREQPKAAEHNSSPAQPATDQSRQALSGQTAAPTVKGDGAAGSAPGGAVGSKTGVDKGAASAQTSARSATGKTPASDKAAKAGDNPTGKVPAAASGTQKFSISSTGNGQSASHSPTSTGSQYATAQSTENNSIKTDGTAQEKKLTPDSNGLSKDNGAQNDVVTGSLGVTITTPQPDNNDTFTPNVSGQLGNESPDGKYIVKVAGKQLIVYKQQSGSDTDKSTMEVRTLNGTWVEGIWSEDSKTFTYSTEQDGTVSNYTYTVPQVTE